MFSYFNVHSLPTRQNYTLRASIGRTHMVLHVTPRDVPYRRPQDVEICSKEICSWFSHDVEITFWGRPHIVLYVTLRDVPYWSLEDVFCRRYEDVPYGLICNSKRRVLQTSWEHPSETSLYGSIKKAKKFPRDKDLCIWS